MVQLTQKSTLDDFFFYSLEIIQLLNHPDDADDFISIKKRFYTNKVLLRSVALVV